MTSPRVPSPSPSLRPFTRDEWYGYEGAESLPSGARPMIGERGLTADLLAVVLVTGNEGKGEGEGAVAVAVHVMDAKDGSKEEWWYTSRDTEEGAVDLGNFFLRCFPSTYLDGARDYTRDLEVLGFRRTL